MVGVIAKLLNPIEELLLLGAQYGLSSLAVYLAAGVLGTLVLWRLRRRLRR
ncbi:MAG: hypothetical protein ACE5JS_05285 [Nitrospinota bacterium]